TPRTARFVANELVCPEQVGVTNGIADALFLFKRPARLGSIHLLRLAMQAFFWLAVLALTKLGMAMAASSPMIATTIMISTRVKPRFRRDKESIFIFLLSSRREQSEGILDKFRRSLIASANRGSDISNPDATGGNRSAARAL